MRVQLIAPLNGTGVGIHAQRLVHEITQMRSWEVEFDITPSGSVQHTLSPEIEEETRDFLMRQKSFKRHEATIVLDVPRMCSKIARSLDNTGSMIAYTVYELIPISGGLLERELLQLEQDFHEIWVPCNTLRDMWPGDKSKVRVVPEGTHLDNSLPSVRIPNSRDLFTIVTVGKFEKRKGHYELFEALGKTEKPIQLEAFIYNPFMGMDFYSFCDAIGRLLRETMGYVGLPGSGGTTFKHSVSGSIVRLHHPEKYQDELYRSIVLLNPDMAVFPTYTEGWGLSILECIAHGIPTMTTYSCGVDEYLKDYLTLLADSGISMFPIGKKTNPVEANDMFFPSGTGVWQEVNTSSLIGRLNDVSAAKLADAHGIFTRVGREMAKKFSWEESYNKVCRTLLGP